jgi:peptidylprolyl isomerase
MTAGKPATITVPKGAKAPTKTVVQPLIEGGGGVVKKGQTVRVAYTGALWKDGSVFDSSASRPEQPYFDFPIGGGQVIKGWDEGLQGQKVGSRVLLVIPPADGYGTAGSPPKISGTDTLVFVVDILAAF